MTMSTNVRGAVLLLAGAFIIFFLESHFSPSLLSQIVPSIFGMFKFISGAPCNLCLALSEDEGTVYLR